MPVLTGLILGNIIFQLSQTDPNWLQCSERSFFEAVAIGLYALWRKYQ